MTNFEKYYPIIKNIAANDRVAKQDKKLIPCKEASCFSCDFYIVGKACDRIFVQWLYEEYKEPIKLTHKQLLILQILETGWLARDGVVSESLYWYSKKTRKRQLYF